MSEPAPPARLPASIPILCALLGSLATIGGLLITAGGWRGEVDADRATLNRRIGAVEAEQRVYNPVVIEMKANLAFLVDRARREDDRRERDPHR